MVFLEGELRAFGEAFSKTLRMLRQSLNTSGSFASQGALAECSDCFLAFSVVACLL
jgi:hypothetical protein